MRRPLRAYERPHLLNLGRLLRAHRLGSGLTQSELALFADLSRVQVARIETAASRTRRSTLARMAAALVLHNPALAPVWRLTEDLAGAAGPALAEESQYAERVSRRRRARVDAVWQHQAQAYEWRAERFLRQNDRYADGTPRSDDEMDELAGRLWAAVREEMADDQQTRRALEALRHEAE
jgi:transcriptional regulator with XRE-family HTH domain